MSDTTDLAALKAALSTFATYLRTNAAAIEGAAHRDVLNVLAAELDTIRLTLAAPANQVFGNR